MGAKKSKKRDQSASSKNSGSQSKKSYKNLIYNVQDPANLRLLADAQSNEYQMD